MKKITAIIISLAMLFAFAACGSKTEPADTTSESESQAESVTDVSVSTETETETEPEQTTVEESKETETTEKVTEKEEKEESETEKTTEEETTEAKVPQTKEEILAVYNDAVNSAYKAKAGFSKERYTDNENYDMSVALKPFKSLVEKFIGIGADNRYSEKVTKGKWDEDSKKEYLRKSTLTAADINDATVKTEGKYYIVTIKIKDGSSVGDKNHKTSSSPIDKCGICVGNEDKGYYDHKSGPVIYDAIAGTYEGASITESYNNARAVAKVDIESGKLVSLTVEYDIKVGIDISIGSGTATGSTHVIYKDFVY
ncbi:MAG: hypothetical protein IKH65_10505 [Clostridia bacterium]|nr:hypothetical protein [Clostridia bacterium]